MSLYILFLKKLNSLTAQVMLYQNNVWTKYPNENVMGLPAREPHLALK
jgi:hypothetical protein